MGISCPHDEGIMNQLREAYGRVVYTYTTHLKKMNSLDKYNRYLKLVKIGLSAISTGGFLNLVTFDNIYITWIGGICSTILLFLNLYFKEFNLSEQSKQHRIAADNLWLIREKYISLMTDFNGLSAAEIILKRDELLKLTYDVYKKAPKTDEDSYHKAQKALKSEDEQFFSPEEIDKMLPLYLRIKS